MAKHFVAVCVVCLLCADHLPCQTHLEGFGTGGSPLEGYGDDYYQGALPKVAPAAAASSMFDVTGSQMAYGHVRRKRHHLHQEDHDEPATEMNENSRRYIEKVFEKFGNGEAMDLNGFQSMLEHLGLTNLLAREQPPGTKKGNCLTSTEFITRIATNSVVDAHKDHGERSKVSKREVHQGSRQTLSTSPNELVQGGNFNNKASSNGTNATNNNLEALKQPEGSVINQTNAKVENGQKTAVHIVPETMYSICPILVYHLMGDKTNESCLAEADITFKAITEDLETHGKQENDRALVWIYASVSVLGVILCGMLGFAVIPCMDKSFYNTMLQFLVALAVGTLAGDALLHLLPHAMILSMETAGPAGMHTAMTCKGLVAVVGVIAFFAIERGLTMIAEWRKERQKKQQLPGKVRVMRDPESVSLNNSEKQCKNKYSSYPYCYDEIAMDTKDDHHHHNHHSHHHGHSHGGDKKACVSSVSTTSLGTVKQNSVLPLSAKSVLDESPMSFDHSQLNHHHDVTTPTANGSHKSISKMERLNSSGSNNNNNTADNNTVSTTLDDGSSIESSRMLKPPTKPEEYTVILREHESKHHGHSHTHGHVHSPPGSLSAVAWMVVMGDGLHNFTDGMAIGAAFSNDIAGGFSTAIAVFCHELPHELGDFAVLLKAGMSAKKAVYYNFLSSILSFLGMVLGICIGDTPEASAWIFAVAAGLFIYIALVDMVPELTSSHRETCAGSNTLLQVTGMCAGLVIMFLIALNEEGLKSLFTDEAHHHHH